MELTLDEALQKGIEAHKTGQIQEAGECRQVGPNSHSRNSFKRYEVLFTHSKINSFIVYVSTDYVFDGQSAEPEPARRLLFESCCLSKLMSWDKRRLDILFQLASESYR